MTIIYENNFFMLNGYNYIFFSVYHEKLLISVSRVGFNRGNNSKGIDTSAHMFMLHV